MTSTPTQVNKNIESALRFYRVSAIITGSFLLLLVLEMVVKYFFGYTIWSGGNQGLIALVQNPADDSGLPSDGINVSKTILMIHGFLYVVYLFADFRLFTLLRWRFTDFIVIALGGVVPLMSFITERIYHKRVLASLAGGQTPNSSKMN
jgi:integral membrane protein